ncbi:polysaccharide biosynthesis tyrosine autokinase [uncultured Friedmanniella sp.]|uniref:polysaccharide biosynthesis tyrosine autokinase n=1 Tax=uncultured Friedmanniella sp. TaxID=335381 RepID=UPI0035C95313
MNLASTLRLLLRHWLFIILVTLLVGAGVYAVSSTREAQYTATTSEYFTISVGQSAAELAQGSNYVLDQMPSFGQLATSPSVLNPVIDDLGLQTTVKQLSRTITVTTPRNTVVMQINAVDPDPARAAAIANAIGSQLSNAVDSVGPKLPNGKSLVTVQSIQTAIPPTVQSSPNGRRDTALGLLIGLLLACGIVLLRSRLDSRVRTPDALAAVTEEPLLGTVRQAGNLGKGGLVVVSDGQSASAEDVRHLRSNVEQLALGRPSYALAVTSSVRKEGRSTIAANLAAALAEAGHTCVLVDADLRSSRVAQLTGATSATGLLGAVADPASTDSSIQRVERGGFDVLTTGGTHDNPTELLSSPALATLVTGLRERYDFVVIDSPALLAAADVTALRSQVDGALMVADATTVRRHQLTDGLNTAGTAGLKVVGVVLNEVAPHEMVKTSYPRTPGRRAAKR